MPAAIAVEAAAIEIFDTNAKTIDALEKHYDVPAANSIKTLFVEDAEGLLSRSFCAVITNSTKSRLKNCWHEPAIAWRKRLL